MSELTILDTGDASEEVLDAMLTTQAFAVQATVTLLVADVARMLYQARSAWLGGGLLPWGVLSPQQRAGYILEVEELVKGEGQ